MHTIIRDIDIDVGGTAARSSVIAGLRVLQNFHLADSDTAH